MYGVITLSRMFLLKNMDKFQAKFLNFTHKLESKNLEKQNIGSLF